MPGRHALAGRGIVGLVSIVGRRDEGTRQAVGRDAVDVVAGQEGAAAQLADLR